MAISRESLAQRIVPTNTKFINNFIYMSITVVSNNFLSRKHVTIKSKRLLIPPKINRLACDWTQVPILTHRTSTIGEDCIHFVLFRQFWCRYQLKPWRPFCSLCIFWRITGGDKPRPCEKWIQSYVREGVMPSRLTLGIRNFIKYDNW